MLREEGRVQGRERAALAPAEQEGTAPGHASLRAGCVGSSGHLDLYLLIDV